MLRVAMVTGSTRPGRNNAAVARWVYDLAKQRSDAEFELVDIAHYHLPLLDEAVSPIMGQYSHAHTKAWAAKIGSFDAYVFVTPEYNHGISGALKNAIDYLYREWNNKAAGFVSYGGAGGVRAVEQLRLVMGELMVADVRAQVMLSLFTDFEHFSTFTPDPRHEAEVHTLLDQVIDINLTGTYLGIRAVVSSMRKAGGGAIVNTSAGAGMTGTFGLGAYVASKWGVRGLTKTAALELARDNIRVNSIHPGNVRTPMVAGPDAAAVGAEAVRDLAIPRIAEPEEITQLVLFVASDEASFSTGSEFIADGGQLLGPVPQHERAAATVA
jgi:NAD(P)H-dependent FMN reductase